MSPENNYYVYAYLRNRDSEHGAAGSPYYIGKGKDRRAYRKSESEIQRPRDRERIIFLRVNLSEQEAHTAERDLIHQYGRIDQGTGCLRNRTDGGEGGSNPSAETRQKMRQAKLGKAPANKGKRGLWRPNEEQKQKHRQAMLERWARINGGNRPLPKEPARRRGEALRGRPRSEETKRKLSEAHKGKKQGPPSPEHRAKISEALKGMKKSPEAIQKRTETRRIRREAALE